MRMSRLGALSASAMRSARLRVGGWVARTARSGTTYSISNVDIVKDSSGYVYTLNSSGYLNKFDSSGALVWTIGLVGWTYNGFSFLKIDGSNDLIVAYSNKIAKINSSGSIVWNKSLTIVNTIKDCAIDGSNDIYILSFDGSYNYVTKLVSAGTSITLFVRTPITAANIQYFKILVYGSNLYLLEFTRITKISTAGTFVWNYDFTYGGTTPVFKNFGIDNSGSIIISMRYYPSASAAGGLIKLSDSGSTASITWQKYVYSSTYYIPSAYVTFDASNYIYVGDGDYLAKFNSSGVFSFENKFTVGTQGSGSVIINSAGNKIYFGGRVLSKVPTNGTGYGTYGFTSPTESATYSSINSSGFTFASSSLGFSSSTLTFTSVTSPVISSGGITLTSNSLTNQVVNF